MAMIFVFEPIYFFDRNSTWRNAQSRHGGHGAGIAMARFVAWGTKKRPLPM